MAERFKTATLKVNNGSIVVYYSNRGEMMRFPTQVTISRKRERGKWVDWNERKLDLVPTVDDYQLKSKSIKELLQRANSILRSHFDEGVVLSAAELERLLQLGRSELRAQRDLLLVDAYEQFYQKKKDVFLVKNRLISLKDYTSVRNMFYDYEATQKVKLKVVEVNEDFLLSFLKWMKSPQPPAVGEHVVRTKGLMNDKTCKKRFSVITSFFGFLKEKKIVAEVDFIKKFVRQHIEEDPKISVTLTIEEVIKLYSFKFQNDTYNRIRDLFVFACCTGMRYEDLRRFDNSFIVPLPDGGVAYQRLASKTAKKGIGYIIPLSEIPLEILSKYGGSLKPIMLSNAKANQYLKEAVAECGMFANVTQKVDKYTGHNLKRCEVLSMHKGRDTFISNLVNTTPLNELMQYTGHSKIETLQKYIDMSRSISSTYVTIFNPKKI